MAQWLWQTGLLSVAQEFWYTGSRVWLSGCVMGLVATWLIESSQTQDPPCIDS